MRSGTIPKDTAQPSPRSTLLRVQLRRDLLQLLLLLLEEAKQLLAIVLLQLGHLDDPELLTGHSKKLFFEPAGLLFKPAEPLTR